MKLEEVLEEIGRELDEASEFMDGGERSEKITEFQTGAEQIRRALEEVEAAGRVMRLGIVGEVKAGKTSFLNALLFDGRTVLPKAATPMTAALTRIRYSSSPSARVVFYDENDWAAVEGYERSYTETLRRGYEEYLKTFRENEQRISQRARNLVNSLVMEPDTQNRSQPKTFEEFEAANRSMASEEERSCHEVYQMARLRLSGAELQARLGTEETISSVAGMDFMEELSNYVGAEGAYTPIVKYTVLELDLPELEGVEIIDTPGMNDPILSRGRTTKNFLKECDALFLLSYCGQFLGAEDMQLISKALPEDGVARCVLIGTKLDSAIQQYSNRKATFEMAYRGTRRNCIAQAEDNIRSLGNSLIQQRLSDPNNPGHPPRPWLTSAMAYSAALKMEAGSPLDREEAQLAENLTKRFSDFKAYTPEEQVETLKGLSQIEEIRRRLYPEIRADKDRIMEESKRHTREGQRSRFLRLLEEIANETRQLQRDLRDSDLDQLREKLRLAREGLDSARAAVTGIFDSAALRVEKTIIPGLQVDVRTEVNNHLHINVVTETHTEHRTSTSGWFIFKKTTHWDEHITTHTAEVADVERNLRNFYTEILRLTNDAMGEAVQLDSVKDRVLNAVMKAFDTSDRNFDENAILIPMNNTLERITIARIDTNLDPYLTMLDGELSGGGRDSGFNSLFGSSATLYKNGAVQNEAIPALKRAQERVMGRMTDDICGQIAKQGEKIARGLEEQASVFIDQITEKLEVNHKKVEAMIDNKQENLNRLEAFINLLTASKKRIQEADR